MNSKIKYLLLIHSSLFILFGLSVQGFANEADNKKKFLITKRTIPLYLYVGNQIIRSSMYIKLPAKLFNVPLDEFLSFKNNEENYLKEYFSCIDNFIPSHCSKIIQNEKGEIWGETLQSYVEDTKGLWAKLKNIVLIGQFYIGNRQLFVIKGEESGKQSLRFLIFKNFSGGHLQLATLQALDPTESIIVNSISHWPEIGSLKDSDFNGNLYNEKTTHLLEKNSRHGNVELLFSGLPINKKNKTSSAFSEVVEYYQKFLKSIHHSPVEQNISFFDIASQKSLKISIQRNPPEKRKDFMLKNFSSRKLRYIVDANPLYLVYLAKKEVPKPELETWENCFVLKNKNGDFQIVNWNHRTSFFQALEKTEFTKNTLKKLYLSQGKSK